MKLRDILTARALASWAGTDRLSALPLRLPGGPHETPVAKLFGSLVGGDAVELSPAQRELVGDLVDSRGTARCSVLPHGRSLLVCDRLDADFGMDLVCWPDDSSYHLALAIPPGRRASWLDVACGSAFAPLLRPELAERIVGAEINPRAVEYARLGIALSDLRIDVRRADLTDGIADRFELVTCNAPIPADVGPLWRSTADTTFFARLFEQAPRVLTPGGMLVLHAALDHASAIVEQLPGERVVVSYVPEGGRQFGIVWWQPDAPARLVVGRRELTDRAPHLTHADRLAALA